MEEFEDVLRRATSSITERYFRLPVSGGRGTFRERVYCYELYHQMRRIWPEGSRYSLNGEVDKGGHPFLEGHDHLKSVIPDLLVHVPGTMEWNFAIIEVKPGNARMKGVRKDLNTLTAFLRDWEYQRGVLLFYGLLRAPFLELAQEAVRDDPAPIEVWHHANAGHHAVLLGRLDER